jgi:hypothetical protein
MKDERAREIAEHIDRLITVDFHTRRFIVNLYEAARKKMGDMPLTYIAAKALTDKVKPGSTIVFLPGFPTFGTYTAEQDGPVGASMLARVLAELFGARVVVLTDEKQTDMVKDTFMGAGFSIANSLEDVIHNHQALIEGVKENTQIDASEMLDKYRPAAVVAIERPSRNVKGKYMSMKGIDLTYKIARLDEIVLEAKKRGVITIGVGDGGNELGCGLIKEDVAKYHPNGKIIASNVSTDCLVFASISNLGSYGIAGAAAAISSDAYVLPSREVLFSALAKAASCGLHNGPPLWLDPGTDGIPYDLELFIWEAIRRMVWEELNPHFPKFY